MINTGPWWKRRRLVLPPILALAIVVSSSLWWGYRNLSDDVRPPHTNSPVGTPQKAPPNASGPLTPEEMREQENEEARRVRDGHPKHFKCRNYPPDAELQPHDLIPTGNVIATITYNPAYKQYEARGDNRVRLEPPQHADHPPTVDVPQVYRTSYFTWAYMPGVVHYGVFVYGRNRFGDMYWTMSRQTYNPTIGKYGVTTYPDDGESTPLYMIVATDPSTCEPGSMPLPKEFSWDTYKRPEPDPQPGVSNGQATTDPTVAA